MLQYSPNNGLHQARDGAVVAAAKLHLVNFNQILLLSNSYALKAVSNTGKILATHGAETSSP